MSWISGVLVCGLVISICRLSTTAATESTINNKIVMYQEENLIALFPEHKSDILVQQQLETYVDNNDKIKRMNEEKNDIAKKKWITVLWQVIEERKLLVAKKRLSSFCGF